MPTNATLWGSTVTVEVSSAAPDADPVWVDISNSVSFRDGQLAVGTGRQTDLTGDDPSQLTLAIRDDDHAYATGTLIRQARRIRLREHFGLHTIDLIDAYIQVPTTTVPMDLADGSQAEITLSVSAVDKLARLRSARKFVSTLGAHVLWSAGSGLKGWWPVTGPESGIDSIGPLTVSPHYEVSLAGQPQVSYGGMAGPPGDDGSYVTMTPVVISNSSIVNFQALSCQTFDIPLTGAECVLVAFWVRHDVTRMDVGRLMVASATGFVPPYWLIDMDYQLNVYQFTVDLPGVGGGLGPIAMGPVKTDSWQFVGMRLTAATNLWEFWIDDQVFSGIPGTTIAPSGSLQQIWLYPLSANHSYAHAQIIVGTDAQTNHAAFLKQREVGLFGLEGQLTGERVNTILDYAGVPAGARDIDPGTSRMSIAQLAGKDPLAALEEARATELGRLFMSGSGRATFYDRQRNYNI